MKLETYFSLLAIIWIKDPKLHEVSVAGLRQGVTKKNHSSSKARFSFYLLNKFVSDTESI